MKIKLLFVSILIFQFCFSQNFISEWDNGFKIYSDDGNFKLKFGGRIMYDDAMWSTNFNGEDEFFYGSEFRRVRFFNSGQVYNNIKYKLQFDFAGGNISFKDVYIEIVDFFPYFGNIKVGHFKEPFRLEALTSSKYITFMERALPIAFSPERNVGVMFYNTFMDKRLSVQVGLFQQADTTFNVTETTDNRNITSRITFLPIDNGDNVLHLGLAYSYRTNSDNTYKVETRPESHMGNKLISTDIIEDVKNVTLMGTEIAFVMGALSIQGEYITSSVWSNAHDDYNFSSYYSQVSYFITGEKRNYKNSFAGFDRVKPNNNMGDDGFGALELALRYSSMDLSEADAGTLNDITVGLNWYLNPCTRVMFNYVMGTLEDHHGEETKENTFQCRMQIDF